MYSTALGGYSILYMYHIHASCKGIRLPLGRYRNSLLTAALLLSVYQFGVAVVTNVVLNGISPSVTELLNIPNYVCVPLFSPTVHNFAVCSFAHQPPLHIYHVCSYWSVRCLLLLCSQVGCAAPHRGWLLPRHRKPCHRGYHRC